MELNLPVVLEAIERAIPERPCTVTDGGTRTWAETMDQVRRWAALLAAHGIGRTGEVDPTDGWRCSNDRVALLLTNCPEYLEAMVGCWRAAATAVNVNYRYVADELRHVLGDSGARAVVFHGRFAPVLAEVLPALPHVELLVQVDDGSPLLEGAVLADAALGSVDPRDAPPIDRLSPADRYVLYTGGTTGRPKGVLWRQCDFAVGALGVRRRDGGEHTSVDEIVERARRGGPTTLPAPPFMHGAAHWNALAAWLAGGTVVLPAHPERFDAAAVLAAIERHRVTALLIVGDAFAGPLLDELERSTADTSSLRHLLNGGAALTERSRLRLLEHVVGLTIVDVLGASESGRQAVRDQRAGAPGALRPSSTTVVLSEDRTRVLSPGDPELGWLAQRGRVPRGYLGDPERSSVTFPVIDGIPTAVPGDRVRLLLDGSLEFHGRDAATINTGGEKVFAEEIEEVLRSHPEVADAVVVGRPSERFGQEVAAIVALRPRADVSDDALRDHCRSHLAGYKVPRAIVRRDTIERSPSGKADYRWAMTQAAAASPDREGQTAEH